MVVTLSSCCFGVGFGDGLGGTSDVQFGGCFFFVVVLVVIVFAGGCLVVVAGGMWYNYSIGLSRASLVLGCAWSAPLSEV